MNLMVGDSRVRGFKKVLSTLEVADVWSRSGGKIEHMADLIEDLTILHHGEHNEKAHFYIWVGICNLTKKLKGRDYEEVIFSKEEALANRDRWCTDLRNLTSLTKKQYATPIFCPLYPMDLAKWNQTRLASKKTKTLKHSGHYDIMQKNLEDEVAIFNKFVINLNLENGVKTPMVHNDFFHSRGKGRVTPRYGELKDGCHPSIMLKGRFKKSILMAMSKNRRLHRN